MTQASDWCACMLWHFAGVHIGDIQNVMGVLYSATTFQGMFNLMNVLPVIGYERAVFYRCSIPAHFTIVRPSSCTAQRRA